MKIPRLFSGRDTHESETGGWVGRQHMGRGECWGLGRPGGPKDVADVAGKSSRMRCGQIACSGLYIVCRGTMPDVDWKS